MNCTPETEGNSLSAHIRRHYYFLRKCVLKIRYRYVETTKFQVC
jgi:hypothetical protein